MDELTQLTLGQKAVVDAYLASYEPAETFDFDVHILVEKGYRAYYGNEDAINGWILKPID